MPNHLQETDDKLIGGHLDTKDLKNGKVYYLVIDLKETDANGKKIRKPKWIPTGLPVKGNKKRAEALLQEARKEYTLKAMQSDSNKTADESAGNEPSVSKTGADILFADYILEWLKDIKGDVRNNTYGGYSSRCNKVISPYFRELECSLSELESDDITNFYAYLKEERKLQPRTIKHYHFLLHGALKAAIQKRIIKVNPMEWVKTPTAADYRGKFLSISDANKLLQAVKGHNLETVVKIALFYGLRRSEIIGLKWDAIDYDSMRFTIQHTVTKSFDGSKVILNCEYLTKNKSSYRSMPLTPQFKDILLNIKAKHEENRKLCGRSYNKKYLDYVFVDDLGDLIHPDSISRIFKGFLSDNDLRIIRFHDLRHSCASIMHAKGASMKEIQEWLGHSDIKTTGMYTHLEFESKQITANKMIGVLDFE